MSMHDDRIAPATHGARPHTPPPWARCGIFGAIGACGVAAALSVALAMSPRQAPVEGQGDDGVTELPAAGRSVARGEYRSPYSLAFSVPIDELLFDQHDARGQVSNQSSIPFGEWNGPETRRRYGAWGPPAKRFDMPERVRDWSPERKRERVVAAASRHIGLDYQHHHIPGWSPARGWPWKKCCTGHNGPGIDCSNFSSWNYNWALGIHFTSAIGPQSRIERAQAGEREIPVQRIDKPAGATGYADLCARLLPGDLLFIKSKPDAGVSHVIMWVGACGRAPDGAPLVIDSTGSGHKDSNGVAIPSGVHLRPFTEDSWYFRCLSHGVRVVGG